MDICPKCERNSPSRCAEADCPYFAAKAFRTRFNLAAKDSYFGAAPSIFVGRHGYPRVSVGILGNEGVTDFHDAPRAWAQAKTPISAILELRSALINSAFPAHVKSFSSRLRDRFAELSQDIAMAARPVDVEVTLDKTPQQDLSLEAAAAPFGPRVGLRRAVLASSPKIPAAVERTVGAADVPAKEALLGLSPRLDEHALAKLLSAGTLGLPPQRRLVPTRWSITAVDDTLGRALIAKLRDSQDLGYALFSGAHLGNHYYVACFPGPWSYELFEVYLPNPALAHAVMTDHEFHGGRTDYAENTGGGYYAARLAILEELARRGRRASILAVRLITKDYYAPLGVWVVREAARAAMASAPQAYSSRDELLAALFSRTQTDHGYNPGGLLARSKLLHHLRTQRRLGDY